MRLTKFTRLHRPKIKTKSRGSISEEVSETSITAEESKCVEFSLPVRTSGTRYTPPNDQNKRVRLVEPNDVQRYNDDDQSILSGGTEEEDVAVIQNLERLSMRLDGFDAYVLVGLWVSTSCFGDLLIGDFKQREGALPMFVRCGVIVCGLFISLFGLYSTVVFATTILYGKTAVGLNRDDAFVTFMANTGKQRGRAFQFLVNSMFVYAIIVCLVAMNELPSVKYLPPVGIGLGYLVYLGASDLKAIMRAASPIFAPPAAANDDESETEEDNESPQSKDPEKKVEFAARTPDRRSMLKSVKGLDSVHFKKVSTSRRKLLKDD